MERRRFLWLAALAAASPKRSAEAAVNFYSTQFLSPENPISENGNWLNGRSVGLDWQNVTTTPGFATFTQPNNGYDDPTAILSGVWGPDQYVRTTVRLPTVDTNYAQEMEIRLRSSLSAHWCSGYEVLGASQIVRWNGPLGDFTVLPAEGCCGELRDGDIFEASIVGNVITVFINGVQVNRVVDSVFSTGSPGMGFATPNPSPALFGFSSFMASDSPLKSNASPGAPTGLNLR